MSETKHTELLVAPNGADRRLALLLQVAGRPWALRPEAMDVLVANLRGELHGPFAMDGDVTETAEAGGVAVIPLHGPIMPSSGGLLGFLLGYGGLDGFRAQLAEAVDSSSVNHIVIDVDSPGGLVDQVPETAAMLREVRQSKPVTVVANTTAASAAYWLAAQGNELVVTPSGQVGSIGVYMLHADKSEALEQAGIDITITAAGRYKTEGNEFEPLSDSAEAARQRKVDAIYEMFVGGVAEGRGTTEATVRSDYGEGRTLLAPEAVGAGLADRVATLDQVVAEIAGEEAAEEIEEDRQEQTEESPETGDEEARHDETDDAQLSARRLEVELL